MIPPPSPRPRAVLTASLLAVSLLAVAMLAAAMAPRPAAAQSRPRTNRDRAERAGNLPREVAREAVTVWNARDTRRVRGDFTLAANDTVRGDVAILSGRVELAGTVTGQVMAINSSVLLTPSGHVRGGLTVIGGRLEAPDRPRVDGDIRVWAARLRYAESGDSLSRDPLSRDSLVADVESEFASRWSRWRRDADDDTHAELFLTTAHAYNRVEGLPIYFGPRFRAVNGNTRFNGQVYGIFRTGDGLRWERENLGHRLTLEVQQGTRAGVRAGGRLFDDVDAVEQWQLTDNEIGLATFLFTRDYRDYWLRHGAAGYVSLFHGPGTELRAEYGEERWSSRRARDVWSIFNNDDVWRVNPAADEGVMRIATFTARVDTRNDPAIPRSGWLLSAQLERGTGDLTRAQPTVPSRSTAVPVAYTRGLLDLRRYNRLAPGAQLNLRAVVGGWLEGDALPAQRRFAVSGIDALPGFDFRRTRGANDVGTCSTLPDADYAALGRPALCERMLLVQAEWKGDFRIRLFGDRDWFGDRRWTTSHFSADGSWVLFANSGRGWLVNGTPTPLHYDKSRIPEIGSWRTDLGGGFDFGDFGVYVAEAVSEGGLKPNLYVRLARRF